MLNLIDRQFGNGRYTIREKIGGGGMAFVFRAYDEHLKADVAMKVLHADEPEVQDRFEREVALLVRLSHPHIPKVLDYGIEEEIHYLVIEYFATGTLAESLAHGPLELDAAARVLSQIAAALDYAHSKDVLHRDIKPANILLDESGYTRLADFGVAHIVSASRKLTLTDQPIGTPAYMSPELFRGQSADSSSEIYALGITLYEVVTGRLPFHGDSIHALIYQHLQDDAPPPREIRADLPQAAEAVILTALAKAPEERYQTCGALAAAFAAAITQPSAIVRPPADVDDDDSATLVDKPPLTAESSTDSAAFDLPPAHFDWIDIPAGEVTLTHAGGYLEAPTVYPVPAFAIAKYPVTNAQFAEFIAAQGYDNPDWWTYDGWQMRQNEGWQHPRFWEDGKWNKPNYPVVGVSWYEALAFCFWLSDATGEPIMLPSEQQWQRAAQGDDGRAYPWGHDWDASRCNNSVEPHESAATSPVTHYAVLGDSPFAVVDMSGNVWEWCSTAWERHHDELEGADGRVVRGGSWGSAKPIDFRTDFRFRDIPHLRYYSLGFRCARSFD